MNLVYKAMTYASKAHKGQTRKVSGEEYITHPMAVSYIVSAFKKSKHLDEILAACWLHDTLEDTKVNFIDLSKNFSPLVATLVFELTSDPDEIKRVGKEKYLSCKMVGISSYALVIKLADRLHNMSDNPTDKMMNQTIGILSYLKKNRKLSSTHKKLVEAIEKEIDNKLMV